MFDWLHPFRTLNRRDRAHEHIIAVVQAEAEVGRERASTQARQLLVALQKFKDSREDLPHDVE